MNKFYTLVVSIVVVAGASIFIQNRIRSSPPIGVIEYTGLTPAEASSDPVGECQAESKCLTIYLAPWCPACHAYIKNQHSQVVAAAKEKGVGILLVSGGDEAEKVREYAKTLGRTAATDETDSFRTRNRINFFPFFILSQNGQVTHHGRSVYDWMNSELMR